MLHCLFVHPESLLKWSAFQPRSPGWEDPSLRYGGLVYTLWSLHPPYKVWCPLDRKLWGCQRCWRYISNLYAFAFDLSVEGPSYYTACTGFTGAEASWLGANAPKLYPVQSVLLSSFLNIVLISWNRPGFVFPQRTIQRSISSPYQSRLIFNLYQLMEQSPSWGGGSPQLVR